MVLDQMMLILFVGLVSTVAGGGGNNLYGYVDGVGALVRFNGPVCVSTLTTGDLLIVDYSNNMIRRITSSGSYSNLNTKKSTSVHTQT